MHVALLSSRVLVSCAVLGAMLGCRSDNAWPPELVRVETSAYQLKVPGGWDLSLSDDGRLEASSPAHKGRWSELSLRVHLHQQPISIPPCNGQRLALPAGVACLESSEGGGSHQQGVSVLIQLKRFQLRFYHHVAEDGPSMPIGRLEQLALVVSRSLKPTVASRPADREPPTPAAALDPSALKPIMVGIGAQMAGIQAALWQEDYPAISKLAQAIAQHAPISPAEVDRIKTTLGDEYVGFVQDDHRVHRTAARLAGVASARDEESTLDELATLQRGCVACHTHHRFKLAR